MGLFNFNIGNSNSNNQGGSADREIELQLNEDSVTISAAEAKGLSVREVFERFASRLGDVDRINKFVTAGRIVNDDTAVEPGMIYRGAISSEAKG
jgi:hypothetical protein